MDFQSLLYHLGLLPHQLQAPALADTQTEQKTCVGHSSGSPLFALNQFSRPLRSLSMKLHALVFILAPPHSTPNPGFDDLPDSLYYFSTADVKKY